jgi:hypothetical protein
MVMVLLFAAMSWHLGLLFRGYQINQSALGQSGMQQRPGGTDWVNWENQNGDVVAQHVHPITEGNPIYANYIQEGDILRPTGSDFGNIGFGTGNCFDVPNTTQGSFWNRL